MREDIAVVVADGVAAGDVIAVVREAGGPALAGVEIFDVYRGAQVGEGRVSLALHLEFRAAGPHPDRRRGRRACAHAIAHALAAAPGGRAAWLAAGVVVVGASGYAGAIAAALLWRHPGFELAAITAREDAGRRLCDIYPHHRVPLVLEAFDLDRAGGGRRRDRRLPARQRRAGRRARCSSAACACSTSRRTSACATSRPTSSGTSRIPHPELIARAVYGLTELYREQIARADAGRLSRLLPDRGDPRARAARARPG